MVYNEQIERQVIGRLKIDNPWWTKGAVPDFFRKMSPRLYLDIFIHLLLKQLFVELSY